ncbi:MAG: GTP 3',8-cyclase MoaA [Planctomycetes bacterium]|nr:GTP 3',8-cyclase MoaA [Planctomycetota bacterium]
MLDRFHRNVTYLRISVTDRCQMSCSYCTLQEEPREVLSAREIGELVRVAGGRLGFRKIRLTGGEPLLRADLLQVVEQVSSTPEIVEVAMTTNGLLLDQQAEGLARAGLRTVNVSLDSLDPERFRELTKAGSLEAVVEGLRAAKRAGIPRRKLNVVLLGGVNDDEVAEFVRFGREEDVEVRFIEHMPMDDSRLTSWRVDPDEVRRRLHDEFGELQPVATEKSGGPAELWLIDGVRVGFIRAISGPFCDRCNRLRVTSEGKIRSCLLSGGEVDLANVLRGGGSEEERADALSALFQQAADAKPPVYELMRDGAVPMRKLGG